jgi:hypothetical protein
VLITAGLGLSTGDVVASKGGLKVSPDTIPADPVAGTGVVASAIILMVV